MGASHQVQYCCMMKTWRFITPLEWSAGLVLVALLTGIRGPSDVLAQQPWPTPPPAPSEAFPLVIPSSQVVPVSAPLRPGSMALQLDPLYAGPVPRIPPRPSVEVLSGESDPLDRISLAFDAGTLESTVQLTYELLPLEEVPSPGPGKLLLKTFRVQMYDHTGVTINPTFRYPVRLTLKGGPQGMAAAGNDPARLLVARFDTQHGRWLPLVTNYVAETDTLLVRILQPGLFGVIAQPSPVGR